MQTIPADAVLKPRFDIFAPGMFNGKEEDRLATAAKRMRALMDNPYLRDPRHYEGDAEDAEAAMRQLRDIHAAYAALFNIILINASNLGLETSGEVDPDLYANTDISVWAKS